MPLLGAAQGSSAARWHICPLPSGTWIEAGVWRRIRYPR